MRHRTLGHVLRRTRFCGLPGIPSGRGRIPLLRDAVERGLVKSPLAPGNGSTINGGGLDRVFDIVGNFAVTMNDLTITNGSAQGFLSLGGAMRVIYANVVLNRCTVSGNSTAFEGGARDDGGGIAVIGSFDAPTGTATLARLTLTNSSVSNNQGRNGGGILCALCGLTVTNSTIANNVAAADGGGVDVVGNGSTVSMTGSNLVNNTATRGGGLAVPFGSSSIALNVNRIAANSATTGGAIFNSGNAGVFADDNWWGCNYGPGTPGAGCSGTPNSLAGPVSLTRYLVLGVSGAPPTLPLNATSTITADLTIDSLGASSAASGTVPNGIAASFTATRGTPTPANATTAAGKASFLYTATGPKGTATITATIDGQTATGSLNVGYQSFTDDPLVPGVTIVKAIHVTELQSRINYLRLAHGVPAYTFSSVAAGTIIQAQHIVQLRTALAQAYTAIGATQPSYTDPTLTSGTVIKAVHISQIRAALIAVE